MSLSESRSGLVLELAEEFLARYRNGERPALTEYIDRHPHLEAEIREVFPAMAMMERIAIADSSLTGDLTQSAPAVFTTQLRQIGDYRIIREIGRGGMGVVYEAEQVSLGRHVALKVLPSQNLLNRTFLERFRREAKAAARLHHTNIVPVFGTGDENGTHYYAMQFIHGQGLDRVLDDIRRLRRSPTVLPLVPEQRDPTSVSIAHSLLTDSFAGPRPGEDAEPTLAADSFDRQGIGSGLSAATRSDTAYFRSVARLGVQVADALAYAHKQGVLHRDIKPSNLLLDTQGTIWVTDFGLAKADGADELTHTGDVVGTIRYMAPERFDGHSLPQSDVYSLGFTLYQLLTLQPAFAAENRAQLIELILHAAPPRLRLLDPSIPRDLETIVLKSLAKDPKDRYATADLMADDLRRFQADRPILARRATGVEQAWRWCRRNPMIAGLLATVVVILLAGTTTSSILAMRSRDHASRADREAADALVSERRADQEAADALASARLAGERQQEADFARRAAEHQLHRADVLVYAAQLARIERDLANDNVVAAQELLEHCRWDLRGWEYGHARRNVAGSRFTLPADPNLRISDLAFSPDDRFLVVAGDRQLTFWDIATRKQQRLFAEGASARSVSFADDGKSLAAIASDRTIKVWDVATGDIRRSFDSGGDTVVALSPNGKLLASAGADKAVRIWNLETVTIVRTLEKHEYKVHSLAFSRDGSRLASGAGDFAGIKAAGRGDVHVWDPAKGQLIRSLADVGGSTGLEFHPDNRRLAITQNGPRESNGVRICDTATGNDATPLLPHPTAVTRVAFDSTGRLATMSFDGVIRLWDAGTGKVRATYKGDVAANRVLAFSRNGKFIASSGGIRQIRLYGADTAVQDPALADPALIAPGRALAHRGTVHVVAFNRDGKQMASAGNDKVIKIWDTESRRLVRTLTGHQFDIQALAFHPDGKRLASGAGTGLLSKTQPLAAEAFVWDIDEGKPIRRLEGHSAAVRAIAFDPDGKVLATGSRDSFIQLWNADTGERIRTLSGHQSWVRSLAFTPKGDRLVSGGGYTPNKEVGEVRVWDMATGQQVLAFAGHNQGVRAVAVSPDGKLIVSAGTEFGISSEVKLWDAATGQERFTLVGHTHVVTGAAFSPDGRRIATSSYDGTVRLWSTATGQEVFSLWPTDPVHRTPVNGVAFSPDGRQLACAGTGVVELWRADPEPPVHTHQCPTAAWDVAVSPDSRLAAVAIGHPKSPPHNEVRVVDLKTGQAILQLKGHADRVVRVSFVGDGKHLASASDDGTIRIWRVDDGRELASLSAKQGPIRSIAVSRDGKYLASGAEDSLVLWDLSTYQPIHTWSDFSGIVTSIGFHPDGHRLAAGFESGNVLVWDVRSGKSVGATRSHRRPVMSIAYSPDGRQLAVGDGEAIRVYDAERTEIEFSLEGHVGPVVGLSYRADGQILVVACSKGAKNVDGEVKLWDLRSRSAIGNLSVTKAGAAQTAVLAADGLRVISAWDDQSIRVWRPNELASVEQSR